MKNYLLFACFLLSFAGAKAQSTPLYPCDTVDPTAPPNISMYPLGIYNIGYLSQCIYFLSDFPGMPAQGQITDVYLHVSNLTPKGSKLKGLTIKMKPTGKNQFSQSQTVNNQIETGLTTVYYDSLYVAQDTFFPGDWMRLTLPIPYNYSFIPGADSSRNLVVEISQDSTYDNVWQSFWMYAYIYGSNNPIRYLGTGPYYPYNNVGVGLFLLDIGFNPKPDTITSVKEATTLQATTIYPNPARDKVYLPQKGIYTLYNIEGEKVLTATVAADNTIDVSSLAKGVYIIRATGKNLVYRFTKE